MNVNHDFIEIYLAIIVSVKPVPMEFVYLSGMNYKSHDHVNVENRDTTSERHELCNCVVSNLWHKYIKYIENLYLLNWIEA